jgi:hypothetical protein
MLAAIVPAGPAVCFRVLGGNRARDLRPLVAASRRGARPPPAAVVARARVPRKEDGGAARPHTTWVPRNRCVGGPSVENLDAGGRVGEFTQSCVKRPLTLFDQRKMCCRCAQRDAARSVNIGATIPRRSLEGESLAGRGGDPWTLHGRAGRSSPASRRPLRLRAEELIGSGPGSGPNL